MNLLLTITPRCTNAAMLRLLLFSVTYYIITVLLLCDCPLSSLIAMTYLLDESVGNVTRTLQERGMLQNSIIIFATDNGGPPAGMSFNHASNWPLRYYHAADSRALNSYILLRINQQNIVFAYYE